MFQETLLYGIGRVHRLTLLFPSKKLEVCSQVHMLRAIDQNILTTPLFFKCITPMASREAHIGSVSHFQIVGLGKIGHS